MSDYYNPWEGDPEMTTYLVPNGLTFKIQTKPKELPFEQYLDFEGRIVAQFPKDMLLAIIEDMETNKYSTRLKLKESQDVVSLYYRAYKSKSLPNIISNIKTCIDSYDTYEWTFDKVKAFREKEYIIIQYNKEKLNYILSESFKPNFVKVSDWKE